MRLFDAVRVGAPTWTRTRAIWIVVSLHVAVRLTLSIWFAHASPFLMILPAAAFAAGLSRRLMRPVAGVLAAVQCVRFALDFPAVSNHYLVECLSVLVFAAVDLERVDERELCLGGLRWLVLLVLFASGLQKVLHGEYFHGQYLAYMVANTDRFADFLRPVIPRGELSRLQSLRGAIDHLRFTADGLAGPPPGPYRVDSALFVAVSNSVWLAEMLVPLGLLWSRTRPFAFVAALLLMAGILGSSYEVLFDTLFINLVFLFARAEVGWRLLPLSLLSYAYYLLAAFRVVPGSFVW